MSVVDQATATQIANIQKKTGRTLEELAALVKSSGLAKHGEIRSMLMEKLGLGHGDANTLVHVVRQSDGERAAETKALSTNQVLDEIYTGPKTDLRSIHEALMTHIQSFGEFEIAPKKGYVSLRRKKQFAMLGPKTNTRFELGLNIKDLPADDRLVPQPTGSMCNYIVKLTNAEEVTPEIVDWVRKAFENAG